MKHSTTLRRVSSVALLASAATVLPLPACAQNANAQTAEKPVAAGASDQLEDIVVTARRRRESLQDAPVVVRAFTAEAIASKGIRDIGDVARLTPGLIIDKGFVPQDVRPNIRGLPATRGRPPVGILLDGIDVSSESVASAGGGLLANLKLVDLERIEVVKGPQSALYGRVAFGGAINYISKEPGSTFEGYLSGEAATYDLYEVRGAVNVPVSDSFAVRVNGLYSYFDGFYDNAITGNRIGGNRSAGGAITARFQPSDKVKIIGRVSYSEDKAEVRPQYYVGGAEEVNQREAVPLPANAVGQRVGLTGATVPLGAFGYVATRGRIGNGIGVVRLSADPATDRDYPGSTLKTVIGSVRAEFDMGGATLSSWTGYIHAKGRQIQDVDFFGRPLRQVALPASGGLGELTASGLRNALAQFDAETTTEQYSQEIRVGNLTRHGFRWAAGALYWHEQVDQRLGSIFSFGLPAGVSTYLDLKLLGGRGPQLPQARRTDHYSAYGILDLDLTSKLSASLEARYAVEDYKYLFSQSIGFAAAPNASGVYPFVLLGTASRASATSQYFAPKGTLTYKPTADLLFYATVSRGVKPGGISQVATANPGDGAFGVEKLTNYEAGFKSSFFNRRLQFNASVFHMVYAGKQTSTLQPVPVTVNPQGNITVIQNIGGARINGLDLEVAALLARGLNVSVGYTYLDPRYTNYVVPTNSELGLALAGNCTVRTVGNFTACYIDNNGNDIEQAARHSFLVSANYRTPQPLFGDWHLLAQTDVQYRGKRFLEDTNSYYFAPFASVDARLGFESKRFSAIAYVNNLFDDRTIKSAQSTGDQQGGFPVGLANATFAPDKRQIGIRARMKF